MRPTRQRYRHQGPGRNPPRAHTAVVEAVLGKPLPPGAVVHHVNGDGLDNRHENLVACQDQAYHNLLHRRERALRECGHASWRKCHFCKRYDDPENVVVNPLNYAAYHRSCKAEDVARRSREKRAAVVAQLERA